MKSIYLIILTIVLLFVGITKCGQSGWTKYSQIKPVFTECVDEKDAYNQAILYALTVGGEAQYVPATFSMSKTFRVNDWYVIESLPYDQAGGYPMVFWRDNARQGRILHWAIARNAAGEYVTAGDSVRNYLDDSYLGIAKPVGRDRYVGVVKRAFTYPRP